MLDLYEGDSGTNTIVKCNAVLFGLTMKRVYILMYWFFFFAGESACQFMQSLCSGGQFSLQHLNIGFVNLLFLCVIKRISLMILEGDCRNKKVFLESLYYIT